ncbi:hypothetical protein DI09_263p10, partial [Mitosporidium daphniae]
IRNVCDFKSIFLELTEIELVILQNILEIEYRDLEYVVIEVWANNLVDENDILFKGFLNEDDRAQKITNIANLIHVIPFKYKRLLLSFFPNIDEDKYLSAYSSSFKINFFLGKSKDLQPNIEILENDIKNAEFMLLYDTPSKLELTHWSNFKLLGFPSGISFLYDLAGSSERLDDFVDKFNSHYLDFIRFYLEMDENSDEYQFVCLFHIIFVVFNTLDDQNLATFFSDLKKKRFPEEVLNIYEKKMGFVSPPSYDESKRIAKPLELSPIGYDSLLIIAMQRKTLSSDLFTSDAHFMLFSDAAFFQEKLKSIVSIDELFSGFPLKALKDPKLLAQILLCGSIKELWTFFIVNDEKIPELLDLLWSHFITTFYCESPLLKKTPFCVAQAEKKEAFTQKKKDLRLVNHYLSRCTTKFSFSLSFLLDLPYGRSYVLQEGIAGGKTTRFGPAAAIVATSILRKLPIFIFPNSIFNQNIMQLRQWLFDFFGKSVFEFKSERSPYGYSGPYLRYLYYRLTMAYDRGDVFVSSMNSIQCLLNARKELLLQNTEASKRSLDWVLGILHFIEHYSIFVLDEADEIMDVSVLYNFDTNEADQKDWKVIDVLIECFLFLRHKKVFESQTGAPITIFEIKEPLTQSTAVSFKDTLNKVLEKILRKTRKKTRALIVDHLFVDCWKKVRNVGYGASMESPVPYPIPYSMANTPREGSSFGNYLFLIAISLKFYLENEMKDLSGPPLFFTEEKIYSILELYCDYDELEEIKMETKSSFAECFNHFREKIYENDDTLKVFFKQVVIESIKTSPHNHNKAPG